MWKKNLIIGVIIGILFIIFVLLILNYSTNKEEEKPIIKENIQEENKTSLWYGNLYYSTKSIDNLNLPDFCLEKAKSEGTKNQISNIPDEIKDYKSCEVIQVDPYEEYETFYQEGYRYMVECFCAYYA